MVVTGARALEVWARRITDGYPNVRILNMTSSWKDGLAFCAILHKFRPDLLDFSTLTPDQIERNCQLVFEIAEKELGIPALLDPKDMASCRKPDRLSILTYLAEFYHKFKDQEENKSNETTQSPKPVPFKETNLPQNSNTLSETENSKATSDSCDSNVFVAVKATTIIDDEVSPDVNPVIENRTSTELSRKDSGDSGVSMTSPRVSCSSPPPSPGATPSTEVQSDSPSSSTPVDPSPPTSMSPSSPPLSPGLDNQSSPSSLDSINSSSFPLFSIEPSELKSTEAPVSSLPPTLKTTASKIEYSFQSLPSEENKNSVFITCNASPSSSISSNESPSISVSTPNESPIIKSEISSQHKVTINIGQSSGLDALLKNVINKSSSVKSSNDFISLPGNPEAKPTVGLLRQQSSPLAARISKFELSTPSPQLGKSPRNDWVMRSMCSPPTTSTPSDKIIQSGEKEKSEKDNIVTVNEQPSAKNSTKTIDTNVDKHFRSCTNPGFKSIRERFQRISLG